MNDAEMLADRATDTGDQTNLVVVLRPNDGGLQALLVADEKGRWSIPGGHAKDGESHAEAATREVKEETGLDVEVQPLMWADHAARKIATNVFYAVVAPDTEGAKPGGGDVTEVRWAAVRDLGSLNGTDRLVIQVAANRIHNPQGLVDDAVELAESRGYAVGNVIAPPATVPGVYIWLHGPAATTYADRLSEWSPTAIVMHRLCESTNDTLARAQRNRHLTAMLESLIHVSDLLWHYESVIAKHLTEGRFVIQIGHEFNTQPLLDRGMPTDLLENMLRRVPRPVLVYDVGESFNLTEYQMLKDALEQMNNNLTEAKKQPNKPVIPAGPTDPSDPLYHLNRLTPRQVKVPWKMEFVRLDPDDPENPVMRCPACKHEGPIMNDFSYLGAGCNGIEPGSEDDLGDGAQECGHCGVKMESDDAEAAATEAIKLIWPDYGNTDYAE